MMGLPRSRRFRRPSCFTVWPSSFLSVPPGRYRVTVDAYPYNAKTPVNLTMYSGKQARFGGVSRCTLGELELVGDETGTLTVTPFLRPGDLVVPSLAANDHPPKITLVAILCRRNTSGIMSVKGWS
ncbi:MAG: hypothetical protein Ct9H300mP25_01040 [Acidobacteriota bacterium]|nr:MAG: hypothetical protein Ct9H300mP25_01040 [Acidobacteriota bacterium]